jgi:hypothetical protein
MRSPEAAKVAASMTSADGEPDDLRELERGEADRGAEHVLLAVEHVGVDGRAGRGERSPGERHHEQERHHRGQRHARDDHDQHQGAPQQVADDHHAPARMPVGQPGQRDTADESGHDADHEGDRREQRRLGPVEDQHRQRDPGQLVTDDRQELRQPQRPELGHREHVAEPDLRGLLGRSPPGHRVSGYVVLRLSTTLRSSVITS